MQANQHFTKQSKVFWANVRCLSEQVGYTQRLTKQIKIPTIAEIKSGMQKLGLSYSHIVNDDNQLTDFGQTLISYFEYRASQLNEFVSINLMSVAEARTTFEELRKELKPLCPLPMNKQKDDKRAHAFFTGIINMLIEANSKDFPCDFDPRKLTSVTRDGVPVRTLARRVDGAFPQIINPIAVWEIKEYYYTTTFGSRIADGVYETLLDGMELEELNENEDIHVRHYLMIDDHNTWWNMGRSYLCRMIDMLHMGYVDEILFGREVLERLPVLVKEWVALETQRANEVPFELT